MLIALTSQLPIRLPFTSLDFYLHDTYFVVGPRYSVLGFALLWGVIAAFYYFGDRIFGDRLSKGLTLAHFVLWIFAVVISFVVEFDVVRAVLSGRAPNQSRLVLAGNAVICPAFLIGGVIFLINFSWPLVRKLRAS